MVLLLLRSTLRTIAIRPVRTSSTMPNGRMRSMKASIFRGRIVDVAHDEVTVEIAGQEKKIEAFIDLMRPFGIVELVRTGRIAMVRSVDRSNNSTTGGLKKYAGDT